MHYGGSGSLYRIFAHLREKICSKDFVNLLAEVAMGIPVITLKNDEASVVAGLRGAIVFHNQEIESREKERNICQKKLDDILHQVALQGNAGYRDWSERHCGSKAAHSYKLEPTLSEDGKFVVLVERWKKE